LNTKLKFLLVLVLLAILAAPGLRSAFAQEDDHLHVEIDIKPGSTTNPINLESGGLVPVALFGSVEFDVKTIDTATVVLGKMDHQSLARPPCASSSRTSITTASRTSSSFSEPQRPAWSQAIQWPAYTA